MTHWTELPLLACDTETTGVNVFTDRIVEVSAVTITPNGDVHDAYTAIIDPHIDIPEGAAAVHGITTERARAEGADPVDVLADVADRITAHIATGAPICMFNARFDWPLLLAEAERHGVDFPCAAPILDPYLIDRLVDRFRKGKRQLGMVAAHYGVELGDAAHGALADATAAGRVMQKITERYPEVAQRSLASMVLWQTHGAEQDRLRFQDYMRTQVDPKFESVSGWPIPVAVERAS